MKHLWAILIFAALAPASLVAQQTENLPPVFDDLAIEEKLGEPLAINVPLVDEKGNAVTIGQYLDPERPTIVNFVYHECPMLCSILLESFSQTLSEMDWQIGDQFDVVTVSFSAKEKPELAREVKDRYVRVTGQPNAETGWHFLTGTQESIEAVAGSAGFKYKWMEETSEYAHPAALIFLSGDGTITRYLHGLSFEPRNVRAALLEASAGRVGTVVDRIAMFCYRYDATANSYVLQATKLMKLGGVLVLIVLAFLLTFFWKRERKNQRILLDLPTTNTSVMQNG